MKLIKQDLSDISPDSAAITLGELKKLKLPDDTKICLKGYYGSQGSVDKWAAELNIVGEEIYKEEEIPYDKKNGIILLTTELNTGL